MAAAIPNELGPPAEFPFPFEPYEIQKDFMYHLYQTLEKGKIGIFESPTGTGKSLSLICGSLKWLLDHNKREKERIDAILSEEKKIDENKESSDTLDWLSEYEQTKALKDEAYKLKQVAERKRRRQERVKKMKEMYGHSMPQVHHKKDSLEDLRSEMEILQNPQDSDIILNEYHSDEDNDTHTHSDSSDCESDEDEPLKIYYASRTHSQLSQFVHEVQKTLYKDSVTVVPLGSRLTYCINGEVKRLKSLSLMNDRCLELQRNKKKSGQSSKSGDLKKKRHKSVDSNGCPYYKSGPLETLRDLSLGDIQDIEQLVSLGRQIKACPYYATRHAVPAAQLVVLPYNTLLHAGTREAIGIKLTGNVVIIDEAHNLLDTISSIHSVDINYNHIKKSFSQLQQYRDRYRSRLKAKNIMYIDQILYILTSFLKLFQTCTHSSSGSHSSTTPQESDQPKEDITEVVTLNDFLMKAKVDNVNMFKVLRYCKRSEIAKKLNGFAQRYLDKDPQIPGKTTSNSESKSTVKVGVSLSSTEEGSWDKGTPSSPLLLIEQFLQALTSDDKDCRVIIKITTRHINQSNLKYLLLNPSIHFTPIVQEARSIIVAGGTMHPMSEFKDQLFLTAGATPSRLEEFSCGHVIKKDHLLPVVLTKGPGGSVFNFSYQQRNVLSIIDELGRAIGNICTVVPGGVVCFFPSYEYEQRVYTHWTKTGQLERISKKKQIFREPKLSSQVDAVLSQYSRCIEFNTHTGVKETGSHTGGMETGLTGALMFCVVGGKLSEGINFSDDLGRCILMIGLPYPNSKSSVLMEKLQYLNKTLPRAGDGRLPGQIHYENLCMKAVNQSIGRAIRHSGDYATIVLVDHRYSSPSVHSKLPKWISSELRVSSSFGEMFAAVRKFFLAKRS